MQEEQKVFLSTQAELSDVNNTDKDNDVRALDTMCVNESHLQHKWYHNLKYAAVGIVFGIVLKF